MSAPLTVFAEERLDPRVREALMRLAGAPGVVAVAAMPDVHLAEDVCIGTVLATNGMIYPAAVGGDIGCGMAAVKLSDPASPLGRVEAARVLQALGARVPVLKHPAPAVLPPDLDPEQATHPTLARHLEHDGRHQLGTLGRGNHFLELQSDEAGGLWLMLHSGSRSFGQAVRDHHLRSASGGSGLVALPSADTAGQRYLADLALARSYARHNRRALMAAAAEVLADVLGAAPEWDTLLECDHNHCVPGELAGRPVWLHRKGAISARDGEPGIIPGSMGSPSYHVSGRGDLAGLWSSSHGAGRTMSRTEARRRFSPAALEQQVGPVWFDHRDARRLVDEAPLAYKEIGAVMRAQRRLTRVVRELRPLLSFKGV